MKIYLAVATSEAVPGVLKHHRPPQILLSYHYFGRADLKAMFGGKPVDVFADSGAFSAAANGGTIVLEDYLAWVKKWENDLTVACAPDVIGDAEATARGTEVMMAMGLKVPVLPVFHVGEPWEFLQHWAKRVPYLALGGLVPYLLRNRTLLRRWMDKAFTYLTDQQVHAFGCTTVSLLKDFPFYSADSSTWSTGRRYAKLFLFDGRSSVRQINLRSRQSVLESRELLRWYGVSSMHDIAMRKTSIQLQADLGAESCYRLADWIEERRANDRAALSLVGPPGQAGEGAVQPAHHAGGRDGATQVVHPRVRLR